MREIVLDTETTGLSPEQGHRIVEIACYELVDHLPTEHFFQVYINPERTIDPGAFSVHGIGRQFLYTMPKFGQIADSFLAFIGDDPLVIHNATFDMKFLNAELLRSGREPLMADRAIDTLAMARSMYPGARATLDALCRKFDIDNSARTLHGALLDCELLAEVYLELIGRREPEIELSADEEGPAWLYGPPRAPRKHPPVSEEERAAHVELVEKMDNPIWAA